MKTHSFPRGGITLEDATAPRADSRGEAFLPALSLIPLSQFPGGRLEPLVGEGDAVREGMLVGRSASGEARAHASVPGRVAKICAWEDAEGRSRDGLLIRMEGSFDLLGAPSELPRGIARPDAPLPRSPRELADALDECGAVEMEGSGRPLSRMVLDFCAEPGPKTLVVRCVLDDPWLVADRVLCEKRMKDVVDGAFAIAEACGLGKSGGPGKPGVAFAVSRGERELGEAMMEEAAGRDIPSALVLTGSKYPQRNRRELELALREYGRREGAGLGALLALGPATLAAARDAAACRLPALERYVAVGGSAVRGPRVMRVRIGKRIGDLFEECGGFTGEPARVVSGSPFFGERVRYLDEPVTRSCYALAAMLESQAGPQESAACISCGECRRVCPSGLDPEEIFKRMAALKRDGELPEGHPGFRACHGCGCCEIVCPSRLPLPDAFMGKPRSLTDA
jgi:electron transport complex protein RnfC